MKSNHKSPIWPYLAVLACLFAVCVLAPRGWQQLARTESIDAHLDAHAPHISDRTRRWQTPPRQMLAASEAVAQPAAEPALASEPIRGAAASNEPAWIDAARRKHFLSHDGACRYRRPAGGPSERSRASPGLSPEAIARARTPGRCSAPPQLARPARRHGPFRRLPLRLQWPTSYLRRRPRLPKHARRSSIRRPRRCGTRFPSMATRRSAFRCPRRSWPNFRLWLACQARATGPWPPSGCCTSCATRRAAAAPLRKSWANCAARVSKANSWPPRLPIRACPARCSGHSTRWPGGSRSGIAWLDCRSALRSTPMRWSRSGCR